MNDQKVISLLEDYETELKDKRKAALEPYTVQKLDEDMAEVEEAIGYMKGASRPRTPIGRPILRLHHRPN